ncbi:C40 family peptidase [Lactococcus taiwanensis]|uniref:C40 family peptidase n=1 Tax=Lactococcus taiwanensis TaxID=1151742 RepID=UPI0019058681|nr:C40 family peptidase [Lactococcus taiwanensis]
MLKKLIFSVAVFTGLAAAIATPVKADEFLVSNDENDLSTLTTLSAASESLEALTQTMDQTVTKVSKAHTAKTAKKAPAKASTKAPNKADQLISTAKKYLGVPYVWGGTTPAGFDCSGFTSYVYREALGIEIGRTTWNQIASGQHRSLDQAQVGDLIICYGGDHVGIYLGNGQVLHAPQPGESVKVSALTDLSANYALNYI